MKRTRDFIKKYVPRAALAALILALVSGVVLTLSIFFVPVADFFNSTLATAFRTIMSALTMCLPFSFAEILIVLIPVLLILVAVFAFRRIRTKVAAIRFLFAVLAVPAFIFSGFVFSLGIPYHTTTLGERMAISEVEVTKENLTYTAELLRDETNALAKELELDGDSASSMNMSMRELSQKITDAYTDFEEEYGFPFNFYTEAKPLIFDGVMSSAHLLGIYTFFTGESNINDGYPDFCLPFTVAHEFAHQRGIIRENEANFLAFVVCICSDDPYIRYSGYLNMYEYTVSALYRTDRELYRTVHRELCDEVFADLRAEYEHSSKYEDSKLAETVGNVNDAYLQLNGTEGTVSYGLAVRLAVAYYHKGK